MTKTRWIWAAATIAVLAALGARLWFGDGPATRKGWEDTSWAAGITAALALIVTIIAWATTSKGSPSPPPESGRDSSVVNTVKGTVPRDTLVQGRDEDVDEASYGGGHVDFRGGNCHGPVTGKQTSISRPDPAQTTGRS